MFGMLGVLESDGSGDHVRCHVCGEWFVSLAHHVIRSHDITTAEYREQFGLNKRQGLMAPRELERRRRIHSDHLAQYHHLTPMRDPGFPRDGNKGPRRAQQALSLARVQGTPEYRAKMASAASYPRPYMAERNRRMAAIKRGQPKGPYVAGEERACIICGTTFRIKPSHPKTCCSPQCRRERRRQAITGRAADMGRIGGTASGISKRLAKAA